MIEARSGRRPALDDPRGQHDLTQPLGGRKLPLSWGEEMEEAAKIALGFDPSDPQLLRALPGGFGIRETRACCLAGWPCSGWQDATLYVRQDA